MTEAVLVAGGGEGKIGNPRFANGVSTREIRESGGARRVKGRRWRRQPGWFFVTLNPGELASGVQDHRLNLRRGPNGKVDDQSHGVIEGEPVVIGRRRRNESRGVSGAVCVHNERVA